MSKLHEIVCRATRGRNLVVCTHCPARDWTEEINILPGAFYVSGHTHKNAYIDNDEYHVFEDNQIGYHSDRENHLKYFDTNGTIDIFEEWEDGIYQITPEQYVDFNCGKQIHVKCNRQHKAIYMLKKWQNREFPIEILGLVYTLPERSRITAANSIKDRIQLGTDKRAVLNKKSYPGQIMNQE